MRVYSKAPTGGVSRQTGPVQDWSRGGWLRTGTQRSGQNSGSDRSGSPRSRPARVSRRSERGPEQHAEQIRRAGSAIADRKLA